MACGMLAGCRLAGHVGQCRPGSTKGPPPRDFFVIEGGPCRKLELRKCSQPLRGATAGDRVDFKSSLADVGRSPRHFNASWLSGRTGREREREGERRDGQRRREHFISGDKKCLFFLRSNPSAYKTCMYVQYILVDTHYSRVLNHSA